MNTRNGKIVYPEFGRDQDIPLVEGVHTGRERVRELEQLLETARHIRQEAERDLEGDLAEADTLVRQRLEAAERIRRKAEAELRRLRLAEAKFRLRESRIWSPGDPVTPGKDTAGDTEPPEPEGDFELALLLGKTGRALPRRPLDLAPDPSGPPAAETPRAGNRPVRAETGRSDPRKQAPAVTEHRPARGYRPWTWLLLLAATLALGAWLRASDPEYRARLDALATAAAANLQALALRTEMVWKDVDPDLPARLAAEAEARAAAERRAREAAWQAQLKRAWAQARREGLARFRAARQRAESAQGTVAASPLAGSVAPALPEPDDAEPAVSSPDDAAPVAAPVSGPVSAPADGDAAGTSDEAGSGVVVDAVPLPPASPPAGPVDSPTSGDEASGDEAGAATYSK